MNFPLTLTGLAGAVALLLWGVHMVQTGVQRAFGSRLRAVLATALRTRLAAMLAGVGVTAILQSSTATGLMVAGFAAGGLVDLVPALAVMLGANIGTTLIVQVLSFDVTAVAPVLVLIGVVMFRRAASRTRDLGRVLIGLGLMLMALHQLLELVTPYEDTPSMRLLLGAVATEPVLDVVLAAGITWAAHSSVAIVLLVMSLAAKGAVPLDAAFALVLGANLGTAINPVLEGGAGNDPVARRVPLGNLLSRLVGVVLALVALPWIGRLAAMVEIGEARAVADFHTAFNLVLAALIFPFLPGYAVLLRRWLPARSDAADPAHPQYLDPAAIESPVVALGGAAREALRLVDMLDTMLHGLKAALSGGDRGQAEATRHINAVVDRLGPAILTYLTKLEPEAMSEADHRRAAEILTFVTNLEHAADVLGHNLLGPLAKQMKQGTGFEPAVQGELCGVVDRLLANLRIAASLFLTEDARAARLLAGEKEAFRQLESDAMVVYLARLRAADANSGPASTLGQLDMLRDLKRVNAHLVAAAAYPVLESQGELLSSRLRIDE